MLVLNPGLVEFGGVEWERVASVAVSRTGEKVIAEWGDSGPHAVLVDVPEQRVSVELVQALLGEDVDGPSPGASGTLRFTTSPTSATGATREVTMEAVIERVWYEVSRSRGSSRRVRLIAVSPDGVADPVSVSSV